MTQSGVVVVGLCGVADMPCSVARSAPSPTRMAADGRIVKLVNYYLDNSGEVRYTWGSESAPPAQAVQVPETQPFGCAIVR